MWSMEGVIPLPLRPRLRRFVVETDRSEGERPSSACWCSRSCCSSSSSMELSVGESTLSGPSRSRTGSTGVWRERERRVTEGRRGEPPATEAWRDTGRLEAGAVAIGWPVATDAVEGARECVCVVGCDTPMSVGKSRIHKPNSRAPMRCESSVGSSRMQNTFSMRKFATGRVIPANLRIKNSVGLERY
jgi:hypothetical protein